MKVLEYFSLLSSFKTSFLSWGMVLTYVFLNTFGAIFLKSQIIKLGPSNIDSLNALFGYLVSLLSYWQTWIAAFALVSSVAVWMLAISFLEFSKAYPVALTMNLFFALLLSVLVNNEPFTISKLLGVLLMAGGVFVLFI